MKAAIPRLLPLLLVLGLACGRNESVPRHVVLVVIDTLRSDAVARAHTPVLDSLARSGSTVERAWSPGTWTVPSMVSMFSGMPIAAHGWNGPSGPLEETPAVPVVPLLAEVLRDHGFATTALCANIRMQGLGFERGFDTWDFLTDDRMIDTLAVRLAGTETRRRFVYLHLMGPHSPLRPTEEAAARWDLDPTRAAGRGIGIGEAKRDPEGMGDTYRNAYHAVVEDTDVRLGGILEVLAPLLDDALLIVTSDHGEMLGEHDGRFAHGSGVWESLTHVPLVVVNGAPLPSTLGLAALPDLVSRTLDVSASWECAVADPLPLAARREDWFAFSPDGRTKTIWFPDGTVSAFDLDEDPREADPRTPRPEDLAGREAWEAVHPLRAREGDAIPVDEETRERLRSLGYTGP